MQSTSIFRKSSSTAQQAFGKIPRGGGATASGRLQLNNKKKKQKKKKMMMTIEKEKEKENLKRTKAMMSSMTYDGQQHRQLLHFLVCFNDKIEIIIRW